MIADTAVDPNLKHDLMQSKASKFGAVFDYKKKKKKKRLENEKESEMFSI